MNRLQKYIYFTIGTIILGMGIALCVASGFGTDPLSVLVNGINYHTGISMSASNAIVCAAMILVGLVMDRKDVTLATVISLFASSIGISIMEAVLPQEPGLLARGIFMAAGICAYTFGTAMSQIPQIGYSTYDVFIYSLSNIFHTDTYHALRWIADGSFLIAGWILGGTAGFGTIVIVVCAGKFVEYWMKLLKH